MITEGVIVGQVTRVAPHPDADLLRLAQVHLGRGRVSQVVFRSYDFLEAGHLVPVALAGARLPTRKKRMRVERFRGQESHGMFCDLVELGWAIECPEEVALFSDDLKPGDSLDDLDPQQRRKVVINESVPGRPIVWADNQTYLADAHDLADPNDGAFLQILSIACATSAPASLSLTASRHRFECVM
jgi:tRNA-binding EMAP/Myf-like protein